MTKQEFQQELKEKVKEGIKPSHLKKSKSTDNILSYSELAEENKELKKELEQTNLALQELIKIRPNPPNVLLQDQLKNKQQELESLRKDLEETNQKLAETTTELDNSLLARYEAVKQFGKLAEKLKGVRKELDENVNQASDELINQDETISQLRTNQQRAQQKIRELEKDLQLAQKLAQMRKYPLPDNSNY